jgi:heat-inducible transcriptional repressor
MISELNDRSREIFRQIVDTYLETGEAVGSRTIARRLSMVLSPATVRNVMADLEDLGLLFAPHTSAGRMPTEQGLRMFVDGILEVGNLSEGERHRIESQCAGSANTMEGLLEDATTALSGLSRCAGLVFAPKTESPLKHIEFVNLSPGRALVILVTENGVVENRVVEIPADLTPSSLIEASNFLSARLVGRTLSEAYDVVESGLASWAGEKKDGILILRGHANLLDDVSATMDLERIRSLFEALETKETMLKLLSLADTAEGVQIFIGADNQLFGLSGCSFIVGSYQNQENNVVGAIGIIGPTRMNYSRIIPMVDYTAKLIGKLIG